MTSDVGQQSPPLNVRSRPGSILAVDDDRFTLKIIEKILRSEGYDVDCTESVKAAKTSFKERPTDVVITDLYMGGKSGLDLLRYLKELQPGVPVIILTAGTDLKNVTEALREGAFDYLQKPFQPADLAQLVARAMRNSVPTIPQNRTVLVVDDDPVMLGVIRATLMDAGYDVITAANAEVAETKFAEAELDVVVSDIILPAKSGIDFLRYCQNRRPEVPVVMVTGTSDLQIAIDCLRNGAFDFLLKPFQEEVLLGRVSRAYERKSLGDANRRIEKERALYEVKLEQLGRTLEERIEERTRQLSMVQRFSEHILKSIPTGIVVVDNDARVNTVNPAASEILRLQAKEITGKRIDEIQALAPFTRAVRETIDSGDPRLSAVVTVPRPNGIRRTIEFTVAPLVGSGLGQPMGAILNVADITEKRSFENAVIQSNRMAAMGQMAAVMSSEVTSRLTIIVGFADLLKIAVQDSGQRDQAEKILQAATQCQSFVETMLRYIGTETQVMREIDIHEAIRNVLELFETEFHQRHIQAKTDFDPKVPRVWGHDSELKLVFFNLFLNARDAMGQGGTLIVKTRLDGDSVKVIVRDTGSGIDARHINDVFVPFFTTKTTGKGTGLGLAICSTIVQRHHGHIGVESTPGQGATFTVRLPPVPPAEPAPAKKPTLRSDDEESRRRVLVVDDDPLILELCRTCFQQLGFSVVTCRTAEQALDEMAQRAIRLALIDVCLPKMDGLQLTRRIRQTTTDLPIVLISGAPQLEELDLKTAFQIDQLLRKPFTQADIRQIATTLVPDHKIM